MAQYKFQANLPAVNGGQDFGLLVEKSEIFPYVNGKKSSDTSIGTKLVVALQQNRLSQLAVKFDHDPLPKISDEDIADATATCQFLYVQIPDCMVNVFSTSNGLGMTATASTAQIVTLKN